MTIKRRAIIFHNTTVSLGLTLPTDSLWKRVSTGGNNATDNEVSVFGIGSCGSHIWGLHGACRGPGLYSHLHVLMKRSLQSCSSSHAKGRRLAVCCSDPYWRSWVWGSEWARGGPSGRQVMDLGLTKYHHLPQQRIVCSAHRMRAG